ISRRMEILLLKSSFLSDRANFDDKIFLLLCFNDVEGGRYEARHTVVLASKNMSPEALLWKLASSRLNGRSFLYDSYRTLMVVPYR
ncbi:hypothetical protein AVEN_115818-1, partial [Araneus ventricosus]